jgi:predicted transcriptional regulator of viral defense system
VPVEPATPRPGHDTPAAFVRQPADVLDPQDRTLLLTAAQRQLLTSAWVAQVLAISQAEARAILRHLTDEGQLVRIGEKTGSRYVLPNQHESTPQPRGGHSIDLHRVRREQILRAARRQSVTTNYVRILLGVPISTARELLNAMVREGDLERSSQGDRSTYHRPRPKQPQRETAAPADLTYEHSQQHSAREISAEESP